MEERLFRKQVAEVRYLPPALFGISSIGRVVDFESTCWKFESFIPNQALVVQRKGSGLLIRLYTGSSPVESTLALV